MARKLKLELEDLSVESFHVSRAPEGDRGTVHGNSALTEPGSDSYGEDTCGWTCGLQCDHTQMGCFSDGLNCNESGFNCTFTAYTAMDCMTMGGGGSGSSFDRDGLNVGIGC